MRITMVARLKQTAVFSRWFARASEVAIFYQKPSYLTEIKLKGTRGSSSLVEFYSKWQNILVEEGSVQ